MNSNKKWNPDEIYDFLIIGSGMGGSSMAHALIDSGASILMLERGEFIKQEKENWSVHEIVSNKKYAADEVWYDSDNKPFRPRMYYNVGGNSKFYGGSAFRFRKSDFNEEWPVSYEELAPWYEAAESILGVRGREGEDPSEPEGTKYRLPPVEHEEIIYKLSENLKRQGLHPFYLPLAIDSGPQGRCRKGSPCDGFPCMIRAKGDAENRFLRPILLKSDSKLTLLTKAKVEKLILKQNSAEIEGVKFRYGGVEYFQRARTIILSAGAVNSAALLLASATKEYPRGLANSSDLVGRYYMAHQNSVMMALSPFRKNPTVFQKTLAVNDFYENGWGNIQLRGKIKKEMLKTRRNVLYRLFPRYIADRSIDLWLMSEDKANRENRVQLTEDGSIRIEYRPGNIKEHKKLIDAASRMMKKAGYPIRFVNNRGIEAVQHQCGTIRMGSSSRKAVLDLWCRSFDHPNLYVLDAGFFPSSAAVNPALTIAAMGLRVGQYLQKQYHEPYFVDKTLYEPS